MRQYWFFFMILFSLHGNSQTETKLFHGAALYSSMEFSVGKFPSITPIGWIYYKKFYFEGRYNYEDNKTFSLYFGRSFTYEKKSSIEVIPTIGLVYGNTKGISAGFNFKYDINRFSTSSQGQYTFDVKKYSNGFFWDWTNAYFMIDKSFGCGGAIQVFIPKSGDNDIRVGPMLRYEINSFIIEAFAFNLWQKYPGWSFDFEYDFD